jgi:flagellar hook-basal body complex protein FliE
MVERIPTGPSSTSGIQSTQSTQSHKAAGSTAVTFRALLDKLQENANKLEEESDKAAGPDELAGAVDRAHASLQDALSLSEQLVEAYRATQARGKLESTDASQGAR